MDGSNLNQKHMKKCKLFASLFRKGDQNVVCQPLGCAPLQIQFFFIKILSSSLNIMLIVDKHCTNEFPMPQIDRHSKLETVSIAEPLQNRQHAQNP